MDNLKGLVKKVKIPNAMQHIAPRGNAESGVNIKSLKKELEESMNEKAKIYGFLGMEVYDLVTEEKKRQLAEIYEPAGYELCFTSVESGENTGELKERLQGKTVAASGPSGVGKSSLINCMQSSVHMQTGEISEKISRGRHTTRHTQLIPLGEQTYIMDTPGFSSMDLPGFTKDLLGTCYPEFVRYEPGCRFRGCSHIEEPDCGVKQALEEGNISPVRYENYKILYKSKM